MTKMIENLLQVVGCELSGIGAVFANKSGLSNHLNFNGCDATSKSSDYVQPLGRNVIVWELMIYGADETN